MDVLKVDFTKQAGRIKPMNAVNNGPVGSSVRGAGGNFRLYQEANIPYARLHDSAHFAGYGGEWAVDVHRIFRYFDADENDPASYVFEPTDKYLQQIRDAGTEIFYRLGASIEHRYKFGTYPPKDFEKWARICEHIIRHYNEGWANGFHFGITYWEIWNEPDCQNADGSNPCWQGTRDEFVSFYSVVAKYLKQTFPDLKIGGPAFCWYRSGFAEYFLPRIKALGAPLDFFSYHRYASNVEELANDVKMIRQALTGFGFAKAETILNEWNYIAGWVDEKWQYSLKAERSLKGASFAAGVMCACQYLPLDMLMYYDARPCRMNGMFDSELYQPLKTYYVIKSFGELRTLGGAVAPETDAQNLYAAAATDGKASALLLAYFIDDDAAGAKDVKIEFRNPHSGKVTAQVYLLDENRDMELIREEVFTSDRFAIYQKMTLYSSLFIKILPE